MKTVRMIRSSAAWVLCAALAPAAWAGAPGAAGRGAARAHRPAPYSGPDGDRAGIEEIGNQTCVAHPGPNPGLNGAMLRRAVEGNSYPLDCQRMVKLLPGVYDIGSAPLPVAFSPLSPRTLEGSGEESTQIVGHVTGCGLAESALVVSRGHPPLWNVLRAFTIHNVSTGQCSKAIFGGGEGTRFDHVTAVAEGGTLESTAIRYGGDIHFFNNVIGDVTATASGPGVNRAVHIDGAVTYMDHVRARAIGGTENYGLFLEGNQLEARGSHFIGSTASVTLGTDPNVPTVAKLAGTRLEGPLLGAAPNKQYKCFEVYDANLDPVICP